MKNVPVKERLIAEAPELGSVLYLPGLPGGGSAVYDRSPYGNTGAITGAAWIKLPGGVWCLSFDGIDDLLNCGNSACFNLANLTVVAWIYPLGWGGGGFGRIVSKGVTSTWALYMVQTGANLRFFGAGFGSAIESNGGIVALNRWQQVGLSYNRVNARFYVNGIYQGGSALSASLATSSQSLLVAADPEIADRAFCGHVALVRVINRPWTTLDFQNSFNREKYLFGVMV